MKSLGNFRGPIFCLIYQALSDATNRRFSATNGVDFCSTYHYIGGMKGFGPWTFKRGDETLVVIPAGPYSYKFFHLTGEREQFKPVNELFEDDEYE